MKNSITLSKFQKKFLFALKSGSKTVEYCTINWITQKIYPNPGNVSDRTVQSCINRGLVISESIHAYKKIFSITDKGLAVIEQS